MDERPPTDTIFGDDERSAFSTVNFDVHLGRWLLKVIGGPNNGAEFAMHSSSNYVIGTDSNSCDIVFHDTSVSRQHARIVIGADDAITIEDLKSRNGTIVDGETIKGKTRLSSHAIITLGTSSFTVYDREGEMHTVISPLLPAIVKTLQKDPLPPTEQHPSTPIAIVTLEKKEEKEGKEGIKKASIADSLGALIVIGMVTGLLVIVGIGSYTLFKSEPVTLEQPVDPLTSLSSLFSNFPSVHPYYNKSTGKLQLTGHVLTEIDKRRLLNGLQGVAVIRELDDSDLVVDEYVWKEINQVLSKTASWKGISVHANAPGKFILTGYLQTRAQAEQLYEYISSTFPYIDLLEKNVVVEEDTLNEANTILRQQSLREIAAQLTNGTLSLTGKIPHTKQASLQRAIAEIEKVAGIHAVKNFVVELEPEQAVINISDRYDVTGVSRRGSNFSVVIQGHILSQGDELDGMIIREIRQNAVLLEKEGVRYRIDFGK